MSKELHITYTNWCGETSERRILPKEIWFGTTKWHTTEQWLLKATDLDKSEERDFALQDISNIRQIDIAPEANNKPVAARVHKVVKLYADGGSRGNPGPSASGYVLLDTEDTIIQKSGIYLGITTNNQAEYQALKFGMEAAQKLGVKEVAVHMDSLLVVNQMKGIYKVKNLDLLPIHQAIKDIATQFEKVTYTHVPRELNKLADAEVNTTLDAEAGK